MHSPQFFHYLSSYVGDWFLPDIFEEVVFSQNIISSTLSSEFFFKTDQLLFATNVGGRVRLRKSKYLTRLN